MPLKSTTKSAHATPARVVDRQRVPPDAARRRLAALSRTTRPSAVGDVDRDGSDADGDDGAAEVASDGGGRGRGQAWAAGLAQGGAWGALAERWVPEPLREARLDPGRRGAVLLCTVAALAALVAAVGVWLSRPTPEPVGAPQARTAAGPGSAEPGVLPTVTGGAAPDPLDGGGSAPGAALDREADPGAGVTAPTAAASRPGVADAAPVGPILVSVTGQVRRPGVVTLQAGARVADAIEAAGGVADSALLAGMNLAAHLTDGASVVVGGPHGNSVEAEAAADSGVGGASMGGGPTTGGTELININTADSATLQQLSGVGPATAEAIIAYRTQHGLFTELSQLQEVSGIGPATYARLAPHVGL